MPRDAQSKMQDQAKLQQRSVKRTVDCLEAGDRAAEVPAIQAQDAGGLKEWTTDQGVDEESVLDSDAAALKKKAEQEDICVPIGEGENCW